MRPEAAAGIAGLLFEEAELEVTRGVLAVPPGKAFLDQFPIQRRAAGQEDFADHAAEAIRFDLAHDDLLAHCQCAGPLAGAFSEILTELRAIHAMQADAHGRTAAQNLESVAVADPDNLPGPVLRHTEGKRGGCQKEQPPPHPPSLRPRAGYFVKLKTRTVVNFCAAPSLFMG